MSPRWRQLWKSKKARFLAVGAYNTLFGYLAFVLLYAWLYDKLHYLIIAVMSHLVAVSNAYLTQRTLVFHAKGPMFLEFFRFNVTTLIAMSVGLAGMFLLVEFGKLHPLAAQAIVTAASVVVSYYLHQRYTFSHGR